MTAVAQKGAGMEAFLPPGQECNRKDDADASSTSASSKHGDLEEGAHTLEQREVEPLWLRVLKTFGPGLMVCLADTDGACLITAAQSGAEWNYKLLLLQFALVPVLYFAQELTVRLGMVRNMGLTALLKHDFGPGTAWFVAVPLLITCVGALISELSVIGATMEFWNVPVWVSNLVVCVVLILLAFMGTYSLAEKVGLVMGACQILFLISMFWAKPEWSEMGEDLISFPILTGDFSKMVTANIGAVIMPWMLAYQQSAIVQKGLKLRPGENMVLEKLDTAVGSFLTQGIMAAMLIIVAASVPTGSQVNTMSDLLGIFSGVLGSHVAAKWVLTFATVGACGVAAIVVTNCAAWCLEEALGQSSQTENELLLCAEFTGMQRIVERFKSRKAFYISYVLTCVGAMLINLINNDVVDLSVWVEVLNGVLMPPVIMAIWYLAAYKLPEEHRMGGCLRWTLFVMFGICCVFCLASIPAAFQGDSSSAAASS